MLADKNIGFIAALISETSRATMLMALMDGQALPASELAYRAQISPATASSHLSKLVEGELLVVERCGRHRYYRLKGAEIGQVLELLLRIAPPTPLLRKMLADEKSAVRLARTCYDHLAGSLGVRLTDALVEKEVIIPDGGHYLVTKEGEKWFSGFGIDLESLKKTRRVFAKQCLDWTERQPHLAGVLGAELLSKLFAQKWIARVEESRAVRVTFQGKKMLLEAFGIEL